MTGSGKVRCAYECEQRSSNQLIHIMPVGAPDSRGSFSKTFERSICASHGIDLLPWEELRSCSRKGVLRGLHFQRNYSQDKLVHVLHGAVYDVAVDLREGSDTFGKWEGFYLTAENHQMIYIPKGFAHGFLALEDDTLFSYLCGDRYDPESDGGIRWDDPQLAVRWPLERVEQLVLSDKDAGLPFLSEFVDRYGALSRDGSR